MLWPSQNIWTLHLRYRKNTRNCVVDFHAFFTGAWWTQIVQRYSEIKCGGFSKGFFLEEFDDIAADLATEFSVPEEFDDIAADLATEISVPEEFDNIATKEDPENTSEGHLIRKVIIFITKINP